MEYTNLYKSDCSVYPGEFVPLIKDEELQKELYYAQTGSTPPPVNMIEYRDSIMVEVAIPGAKREDFIVHANKNEVSVCLLNKTFSSSTKNSALHEFNYRCFERHITLPENVDPEFIHAEYSSGMLRLYIPKTRQPQKNLDTRIVVY